MTEITQADRDAAAEAFFCKPLLNEKHNDDRRVRAFARHREQAAAEERAKIVAWLRSKAAEFNNTAKVWLAAGEVTGGASIMKLASNYTSIADDIEKHETPQETSNETLS